MQTKMYLPESLFFQKFTCWGKRARTYVGACTLDNFSTYTQQVPNLWIVFGIGLKFPSRSPVHLNDRWQINNRSCVHGFPSMFVFLLENVKLRSIIIIGGTNEHSLACSNDRKNTTYGHLYNLQLKSWFLSTSYFCSAILCFFLALDNLSAYNAPTN